jgi:hypothetical protein
MRFISKLEWEGLQKKHEIKVKAVSELLPPGTEKVEIYRDDAYKINARLYGKVASEDELKEWIDKWNQSETENFIIPLDFEIFDEIRIYKLSHCFFDSAESFSRNRRNNELGQDFVDFEANFSVSSLYLKYTSSLEIENLGWVTEWYLNAPKREFHSRLTKRALSIKYERNRRDLEKNSFDFPDEENTALDYTFVELESFKFLIHAVPKYLTPEWSYCLGIEYREEWGSIPEAGKREAIAEIVSFVAGCQLLNVGFTKFSKSGYSIEEFTRNPPYSLGHNLITLCKSTALPPVRLEEFLEVEMRFEIRTEKVLQQLIPNYLALRGSLNLNETLHRFWLFKELPIGDNLPTLAAGVETLATDYLKYKKVELLGSYMSKIDFKELLREELKSIESKLKRKRNGDKLLAKILGAYSYPLGVNARLKKFFEEIQLPIGSIEEEAMQVRNTMVHSSIDTSDEVERHKMARLTNAYESLFNRIILKVLGFKDSYIDYHSLEPLQRPIDQPIGGE